MGIPHPIPYQGSKRKLAKTILTYFPNNIETLIEPFAGSAAITLAAVYQSAAAKFVINDLNQPLMALWNCIINQPDALIQAYTRLWHEQQGRERSFYDLIRNKFNSTQCPECLLYLLVRCVKSAVRYNADGEFNQSPDNRRKGTRPETMRKTILEAAKLLHNRTTITTKDYKEVVLTATPADLIYMDPPYQGVSGKRDSRYIGGVSFDAFIEDLTQFNSLNLSYLVSYDGRTGTKNFGKQLPSHLRLVHIECASGRSTQATLSGQNLNTMESLYISPILADKLKIGASSDTFELKQVEKIQQLAIL